MRSPTNNAIEDGSVCGVDGCSTRPETGLAPKTADSDAPFVHELTIVSDVICPWCFVAKKNLEKALELAEFPVKITWRPFELNPGMPRTGMSRRGYRSKKFGSWEQSQHLDAQVAEAAKLAGITFRHDLIERTPNTFAAHRLIWLAGEEGVQDDVVEALFRAYFVEGRDVGDTRVLAEIAKQAGLTESVVAAFLESAGTDEVRRESETARVSGISGVPTFILDGEALFSGAMKPENMAARLQEAAAAHAKR
jgi:predicted DsbA family dithiol-disulfide isomerase